MINIIASLFRAASPGQIEALSRQVAELSLESVCQLVGNQVEFMTFSEARGYVRARASRIVRKQSVLVLHRQPGTDPAWLDAVAGAATERLVPVVLRQTGVGVPKLPKTALRLAA